LSEFNSLKKVLKLYGFVGIVGLFENKKTHDVFARALVSI